MKVNNSKKPAKKTEAKAPAAAKKEASDASQEVENRARPVTAAREEVRQPTRLKLGEKLQFDDNSSETSDVLYIPPHLIPPGYAVEWKRISIYGKPDDANHQNALARTGWEVAEPKQFSEIMPRGFKGNTIERDGMILMIRPIEYQQQSKQHHRKLATQQLRDKISQISDTPNGDLDRKVQTFERSHQPIDVD